MSQLTSHLLTGSHLEKIAVDDLSLVTPVDNKIFVKGGTNVNTEGAGNTAKANLDDDIDITSAQIGNINISGNTISSTDTNGDILLAPDGSGAVNVAYTDINSGAVTDTLPEVESTSSMTDGQIIMAVTGGTPVARTLTAGDNVTITNEPNKITIAAEGGSGEGGGGGLLSWTRIDYTGSEQRNFIMEPNNGYITNSSVATLSNANYCPRRNINLTLPTTGNVEIGDMFWIVNKGVGAVAIRGATNQNFMYTYHQSGSGSSAIFSTVRQPFSSVYFMTPKQDNTQSSGNVSYVYLSSILLVYVGDVTQVGYSSNFNFQNTFYVVNSVGMWTSRPQTASCFST